MNFIEKIHISELNGTMIWANFRVAVLFTVLLGSACFAASIAEKRGHSPILHFLLGFVLPVIYPVYLSVSLKKKEEQKLQEEEAKAQELEGTVFVDLNTLQDLNADYFTRFPLDESGVRPGPFDIEVEDGLIKAESILEIQANLLVVETYNVNTEALQKLRIPYAKIVNCEKSTP